MAQMFAVLQSDPALLRCQLHRLAPAVDLVLARGKAVGVGYFENGKVLLRKRPAPPRDATIETLGADIRSELFVAAAHGTGVAGFREEDTEPYRFRAWIFAGTGRIVPLGERAQVLADLPEFLQHGLVGPSDAELAFLSTLGHVHADSGQLDYLDLDPTVAATALAKTLARLDQRARAAGVPLPQTCALVSNGRMIAAVRRGRPLSYALLEGLAECEICGLERTATERDPRVRPHRTLKAVALASKPHPPGEGARPAGIQWIDVPDHHLVTVSRSLHVRLTPL